METLPNFLVERVRLTPNRVAVVKPNDEQCTFKELYEEVVQHAEKLCSIGIRKGSHVAVLMSNTYEMIVTIHSLHLIGAVVILMNTRLSQQEWEYQLEDSDSTLLLTNLPSVSFQNVQVYSFDELQTIPPNPFNLQKVVRSDDVSTMMYTSGTTGSPKAVLHTYGNHWSSAIASMLNLGFKEDDAWLICLPMFHVGGLSTLYKSVIYGMKVVLVEKAEAEVIAKAVQKHRVTILSVVSKVLTDLVTLYTKEEYNHPLRCVLIGGGPAPLPLLKSSMQIILPVYQTYGMTETCSQIVTLAPEYMLSKVGSAGTALYTCELKIMNQDKEAIPNEIGEIVVKGPNVSKGYYKRESTSFKDGWLYTGDMGYVDEDGFLFVVDRRSDLIISGGENIYPAEIEEALLSHQNVLEVGVTGKDDVKWGKVPVAFVVLHKNTTISGEELQQFCKERLASYKIPKEIYFVESLPRNAANKLLRRKLIELLQSGEEI
jgi:O-succinylbenzoic acid--CoA ligase